MAPPFPQIEEADARGDVAALYDEVRATLRSTCVPDVFRALALHPAYTVPAWDGLKGNLASVDAEQLAGQVRIAVIDRLKPIVAERSLPSIAVERDARDEIRGVLEACFYVVPKAFVAATALREAWQGRPIGGRGGPPPRTVPRGAPASMPRLSLVDPAAADLRIRRLFDDATGRLGHPVVPSVYRALARWPAYLESVWEPLTDSALAAGHRDAASALVKITARGCRGLPIPFEFSRAMAARSVDGATLASIDSILSGFQPAMSDIMLQVARLLRDLDRGPGGRSSRRG